MWDAPALALEDFNLSLQVRPDNGDAFLGRAEARVRLGRIADALADAAEGVKRTSATARTFFNAARVHAQAAGQLSDAKAAGCEKAAVDLLRQSLALTPAKERLGFWERYVQGDTAFRAIVRGQAMTRLAAEVLAPAR
jgi:hypothetical protein